MKSKDFEKALIDYLYGEMDQSDRIEFEKRMANDEALKKEFEALQSVREDLGKMEDKEVMEPFSIWGHTRSRGMMPSSAPRKSILLRPITAIAASLILLMLVGFATNFSLSLNSQGLQISFQKPVKSEDNPALTKEDVKMMLAEEIQKNNNHLLTSVGEIQGATDARFAKLEESVKASQKATSEIITKKDLNQFVANLEDRNGLLLQEYLSQASNQQQEYFKTMLTQFSEYLQYQRVEDLNMIQTDLLELKYTQTRQKMATDEVLAGLITKVNNSRN